MVNLSVYQNLPLLIYTLRRHVAPTSIVVVVTLLVAIMKRWVSDLGSILIYDQWNVIFRTPEVKF